MRETRNRGGREAQHPKPVDKIELSTGHKRLRLALAVVFLAVGAVSVAYGVAHLSSKEPGWSIIEADPSKFSCADDFVLLYCLGADGASATVQYKNLTACYSDAVEYAFQMFTNNVAYEKIHNMYYINRHPNQVLEVDDVLYRAFVMIQECGDRSLYLGPVYEHYYGLFACTEEYQTSEYDPQRNRDVADYYAAIAAFANNPQMIDVELLGENRICLRAAEEYLAFVSENEIENLLDFSWMKNAFITDYIADSLISAGYTRGSISSYDGYTRNMDDSSGTMYSLNIFDYADGAAIQAARLDYRGPMNFVSYRDFPLSVMDSQRIYVASDGERKTMYLSLEDGLPCAGADSLTVYSDTLGCAEIMLLSLPVFQQEKISDADLAQLADRGVLAVLAEDRRLLVTDVKDVLKGIYDGYEVEYMGSQTTSE